MTFPDLCSLPWRGSCGHPQHSLPVRTAPHRRKVRVLSVCACASWSPDMITWGDCRAVQHAKQRGGGRHGTSIRAQQRQYRWHHPSSSARIRSQPQRQARAHESEHWRSSSSSVSRRPVGILPQNPQVNTVKPQRASRSNPPNSAFLDRGS